MRKWTQNCIFVGNFWGYQHLVLRILRNLRNVRIRLGENTYALIFLRYEEQTESCESVWTSLQKSVC